MGMMLPRCASGNCSLLPWDCCCCFVVEAVPKTEGRNAPHAHRCSGNKLTPLRVGDPGGPNDGGVRWRIRGDSGVSIGGGLGYTRAVWVCGVGRRRHCWTTLSSPITVPYPRHLNQRAPCANAPTPHSTEQRTRCASRQQATATRNNDNDTTPARFHCGRWGSATAASRCSPSTPSA